jgi:hypothetical protein
MFESLQFNELKLPLIKLCCKLIGYLNLKINRKFKFYKQLSEKYNCLI